MGKEKDDAGAYLFFQGSLGTLNRDNLSARSKTMADEHDSVDRTTIIETGNDGGGGGGVLAVVLLVIVVLVLLFLFRAELGLVGGDGIPDDVKIDVNVN